MTTRKELAAIRRRRKKIKIILSVLGGLLVVVAALILLSGNSSSQASGPAQIGQPLKDFKLTDIHGKMVRLSNYAGKAVLINAWATWCPPCKAEMPDLNAYYQKHQDEGFIILAVNAGDSASQAAAFASQKGLAFPVLLDPNIRFLTSLGVRSYPTSILVGSDGMVKAIHVGIFTPQSLDAEITPYLMNAK